MKAAESIRLTRRPRGIGPLYRLCPKCKGSGDSATDKKAKCPRCDGKGELLE